MIYLSTFLLSPQKSNFALCKEAKTAPPRRRQSYQMVDHSSSLHDNFLLEIYLIHDVRGLYTCSGLARGIYLRCIKTEASPSKPNAQGELGIHLHHPKKKKKLPEHA